MIPKGKILKTDSGRFIQVDDLAGVGGQGEVYHAPDLNTKQKGVLKSFLGKLANQETVKRIDFLVNQQLHKACPVLLGPIDAITQKMVGHYSPFAPGQKLEEFFVTPDITLIESLHLGIQLAHAIDVLHQRQIAHGDIQSNNIFINRNGVCEFFLIDFDNFNAQGLPPPPCVGHNLYMAPELRIALAQGKPAIPDIWTDRFSLGVLMHELLLGKHPATGADHNEAEFQKVMCSGIWLQDPAVANRPSGDLGGYPPEILNADLAHLFRSAASLNRDERPSSTQWKQVLCNALNKVNDCPFCGGSFLMDISKTACPLCKKSAPSLTLATTNTQTISLSKGAVEIGRVNLKGSNQVSSRQAVFRRIGSETWIESFGTNGTYRWTGSGWVRLPDRKMVLVKKGDRLRFADLEVEIL